MPFVQVAPPTANLAGDSRAQRTSPLSAKSTRVLCLGDSLTAGLLGSSGQRYPYAKTLGETLGVPVDEIGLSGARTDEMVANMPRQSCVDIFGKRERGLLAQLAARSYTVCVIMAGTNDINAGRPADNVFRDVAQLHTACHERGVRTVALPIPECRFLKGPNGRPMAAQRHQFNGILKSWASRQGGKSTFVDMAQQVPFSDFSGDWAPDGLHMSAQGYRAFGRRLGMALKDFMLPSTTRPKESPRNNTKNTGTQLIQSTQNNEKNNGAQLTQTTQKRTQSSAKPQHTSGTMPRASSTPTMAVRGPVKYKRSTGQAVDAVVVGPSSKGPDFLTLEYDVDGQLMRNLAAPVASIRLDQGA